MKLISKFIGRVLFVLSFLFFAFSLTLSASNQIKGGISGMSESDITEAGVWSSLGSGLESPVNSLALYNGNLCAASYGVAVWDGSKWTDMSNGLRALFASGDVYALANLNNVLFAGGQFTVFTPDGNWYNNAARFDAVAGTWTTCGSGRGDDGSGMKDQVNYLIEYNGQLYAGGKFSDAGGDPLYPRAATYIARFDGAEWHPVGGGMDATVTDMVVYNGDLIASGYFTRAAYLNAAGDDFNPEIISANHIAKWNGVNWSPLGSGMDGNVTALAVHNGELYAGGRFENAGGVPANSIAKWNGHSWSPVGNGIAGGGQVYTLASYNNELYAGGEFTTAGGNADDYIMSWDGTRWKSVGSGTDGPVITLLPDSSGLIVGGSFSTAGSVSANNIAKYSVTKATLTITTTSLPAGTKGAAYSQGVSATGGVIPYAWSISVGSLPAGLALNAGTGAITGTPTAHGTSNFTVRVADSQGTPATATKALSIVINENPYDPNGVGGTTMADVLICYKQYLGIPMSIDYPPADVSGDGRVTMVDVLKIYKRYLGLL